MDTTAVGLSLRINNDKLLRGVGESQQCEILRYSLLAHALFPARMTPLHLDGETSTVAQK